MCGSNIARDISSLIKTKTPKIFYPSEKLKISHSFFFCFLIFACVIWNKCVEGIRWLFAGKLHFWFVKKKRGTSEGKKSLIFVWILATIHRQFKLSGSSFVRRPSFLSFDMSVLFSFAARLYIYLGSLRFIADEAYKYKLRIPAKGNRFKWFCFRKSDRSFKFLKYQLKLYPKNKRKKLNKDCPNF